MRSPAEKVGFYGLDLYSLHSSMGAVLRYLDRADPAAAGRARERYSCFDHFGPDAQVYGFMTRLNLSKTCEREVLEQLKELQHVRGERAKIQAVDGEEAFHAEQNARLIKNAEAYYRSMYLEEVSTWNLRDRHMMETLATLEKHLSQDGRQAKIAVWAHNSHIGDARATEMGRRGELTLGQLAREAYGDDAVLIGFTTHRGTVRAASRWDGEAEIKRVRPALPGSYEAEFHDRGARGFLLVWDEVQMRVRERIEQMLERAIGVIYRPETERQSHYFHCAMAGQFDAVLHFDETKAVEALEEAPSRHEEVPETFPFGV
jgi:erythromycin esterase-like protein